MYFRNNNSALKETDFVTASIMDLLSSHRIIEKQQPSYIVSPLSVAYQASGKKRLILDLSRLNKFVHKAHFKLDDWKICLQFLSQNSLMFSFDLKSGYHHIDILPDSPKYLGFSWEIQGHLRYFEFTVLPFGLSSAPLLFTKILKPLVTHWRAAGIRISLYLDDGFIVVPSTRVNTKHDYDVAQ